MRASVRARRAVRRSGRSEGRAGWDLDDLTQVRFEIPVDGTSPEAWQAQHALQQNVARETGVPYELNLPAGIFDYAPYRENGEVLATAKAKRQREAELQTEPLFGALLEGAFRA